MFVKKMNRHLDLKIFEKLLLVRNSQLYSFCELWSPKIRVSLFDKIEFCAGKQVICFCYWQESQKYGWVFCFPFAIIQNYNSRAINITGLLVTLNSGVTTDEGCSQAREIHRGLLLNCGSLLSVLACLCPQHQLLVYWPQTIPTERICKLNLKK